LRLIAYRAGLTEEEFWESTYYELTLRTRARVQGFEDTMRVTAQHASWVMSSMIKDAPTADELLGKTKRGNTSSESFRQAELEAWHRFVYEGAESY
jgi:hypothetical protein